MPVLSSTKLGLQLASLTLRAHPTARLTPTTSLLSSTFSTTSRIAYAQHHKLPNDGLPPAEFTPNLPPYNIGTSATTQTSHPIPPDQPVIRDDYSSGPSALDKAAKLFFLTEIARGTQLIMLSGLFSGQEIPIWL